jgi:hypothetical protein
MNTKNTSAKASASAKNAVASKNAVAAKGSASVKSSAARGAGARGAGANTRGNGTGAKPQREELSSSQKQQRFAKVVALVLAGALVLSVAAPALSTLFM